MLTDGKVYGKVIDLGSKDSEDNYHEITEEEYEQHLKEEEASLENII